MLIAKELADARFISDNYGQSTHQLFQGIPVVNGAQKN